jgi:hypothetical protein
MTVIKVGDRIKIDTERIGETPRTGEVLEVLTADFGTRYRVRWEDGHESTIHPVGGSIHVIEPKDPGTSQALTELFS